MRVKHAVLLALLLMALSACQVVSPAPGVPARLQLMTGEAQRAAYQELNEVTARMLGLASVTLAERSLIDSSQFAYARTARYDASGLMLQGRVIESPRIFSLLLREQKCWLLDQKTAQQIWLKHARCVAE
ncbi:hypothetical protein BH11PSE12_BH11PSE12_31700 [soil metagenome]